MNGSWPTFKVLFRTSHGGTEVSTCQEKRSSSQSWIKLDTSQTRNRSNNYHYFYCYCYCYCYVSL